MGQFSTRKSLFRRRLSLKKFYRERYVIHTFLLLHFLLEYHIIDSTQNHSQIAQSLGIILRMFSEHKIMFIISFRGSLHICTVLIAVIKNQIFCCDFISRNIVVKNTIDAKTLKKLGCIATVIQGNPGYNGIAGCNGIWSISFYRHVII